MSEKVKVKIPLHFVGEAPAVKALGGTLVKNLTEVEVECLPGDLPRDIEVSIVPLETFENAIRVSDLKVDEKVTILGNTEEVVVTVAAPRTEEEMKALEEKVEVDLTKVEGLIKPEAVVEGAAPDVKGEKAEKKSAAAKAPADRDEKKKE